MSRNLKLFALFCMVAVFYAILGCGGGGDGLVLNPNSTSSEISGQGSYTGHGSFGKNKSANLNLSGSISLRIPEGAVSDDNVNLRLVEKSENETNATFGNLRDIASAFVPVSRIYEITAKNSLDQDVTVLAKPAEVQISLGSVNNNSSPVYLAVKDNGKWSLIAVHDGYTALSDVRASMIGSTIRINMHRLYDAVLALVPISTQGQIHDVKAIKLFSDKLENTFFKTYDDGRIIEDLPVTLELRSNEEPAMLGSLELNLIQKKNSTIEVIKVDTDPVFMQEINFSKNLKTGWFNGGLDLLSGVSEKSNTALNNITYTFTLNLKDRNVSEFSEGISLSAHFKSNSGITYSSQDLYVGFNSLSTENKIELINPIGLTRIEEVFVRLRLDYPIAGLPNDELASMVKVVDKQTGLVLIPESVELKNNNRLIELRLTNLAYSKEYEVSVEAGLRPLNPVEANLTKKQTFVFETVDYNMATLLHTEPTGGSDEVDVGSDIKLVFSEDLDFAEFDHSKIMLEYYAPAGVIPVPTASYTATLNPLDKKVYKISFIEPMGFKARYRITVKDGIKTLSLEKPFVAATHFEFLTEQLFAGGSGTIDDPYLISKASQLNRVRNYLGNHFKQIEDIDLSVFNKSGGWKPIGRFSNISLNDFYDLGVPFRGSYNGNNKTISNLKVSGIEDGSALFACAYGARFFDINIRSAVVEGKSNSAILLGVGTEADISNVKVSGSVKGTNYIGGLAGTVANSKVSNSSADCIVESEPEYDQGTAGGLIGQLVVKGSNDIFAMRSPSEGGGSDEDPIEWFEFSNNSSSGNVTSGIESGIAGGLIGRIKCKDSSSDRTLIINSYSTVNVNGFVVGGLIGHMEEYVKIEQCYAKGELAYGYYCGGLIGGVESSISHAVVNCAALSSKVRGDDGSVFGIVGGISVSSTPAVVNCYFNSRMTNETTGVAVSSGANPNMEISAVSEEEFSTVEFWKSSLNWGDFDNNWVLEAGLPVLK